MNNYLSLTKVFLKSFRRIKSNNKRTRILFALLLIFTVVFIIIPFLAISASFVYDTTIKLMDIEYESIGLQIMCYIICIFTFIFSISALLNELYFSNDIEKLIPLPIKPVQLVASKFTSCFIFENVIQILLIVVSIISYMVALDLKIPNLILSIIEIITLPIIPMIYSGIFCLILMHFMKYIKNKENVKKISTIFVLIIFVLLIVLINQIKDFNFQNYLETFVNGNHKFLDTMNIIFPQIKLFTDTLTNANILSLLKYIVVHIIYIAVFLFLANRVYINSVIDLSNKNNSVNKNSTKLLKNIHKKNSVKSYLIKEIKVLFRTPSFFINCIIINILWPVLIYIFYEIGTINYDIHTMELLLVMNDEKIKIILLLFICGVAIFIPAMNSIAATSFSREGKNFQFIKYIPMSYQKQWLSKYLISFIISFISVFVYTTIFYLMVKLNFLIALEYLIVILLSISCVSMLGVYIDSIQPKLLWDDENNALRENYNTLISMGITTLIYIIIFVGAYVLLYKKLMMSYNIILLAIICFLLISNLIIYLISKTNGIKNLIEQE